jgi:membrane protease YdiL (CAAX protease family)
MDFWTRRPISVNLVGILLLAVATIALAWLGGQILLLVEGADSILGTSLRAPVFYIALAAATILVARFYDSMPAAWAGLGPHRWALRELGLGLAIGGAMALAAWGPAALMGDVVRAGTWSADDVIYILIPMAIRAAGEEVLFRGYLFQRAAELMGPAVATVLTSVIFAAAHLANPNVTPAGVVVILLGGIFFALGYLRTGSLWLPIGAHVAWNVMLGKVLGLPVSGQDFGDTLLRTTTSGPAILTGGAFGPEGGLVGAAALALGIWALLALPAIMYSPYVYAQVFRAFYKERRGSQAAQPIRPAG